VRNRGVEKAGLEITADLVLHTSNAALTWPKVVQPLVVRLFAEPRQTLIPVSILSRLAHHSRVPRAACRFE